MVIPPVYPRSFSSLSNTVPGIRTGWAAAMRSDKNPFAGRAVYAGSSVELRYRFTVLRDSPVRRPISRTLKPCRFKIRISIAPSTRTTGPSGKAHHTKQVDQFSTGGVGQFSSGGDIDADNDHRKAREQDAQGRQKKNTVKLLLS